MIFRDLRSGVALSRILNRFVVRQEVHWTHRLARFEFCSGLGDSAWLLFGIARSLKPAIAVEIGSARGKSACFIGMALKENGSGRLYAIDPHTRTEWNDSESVDTYDIIRDHLEKLALSDVVTIVRKRSIEMPDSLPTPIDLLFIDGDHSYEGVKADWAAYRPRMSPFGLVVFHDTIWDLKRNDKWYRSDIGVPRFVEDLRQQGYPIITIKRDCGLSIVQPIQGGNSLLRGADETAVNRINSELPTD
jgi:predicted O-methyltransferase YrrM